ncbi:MAG: DUF4326 domain-containing protein [Deinococcus sp.]|nr:DUF4326 domain-containing protein [Deinococcus sp.]
MPLCSCGCGRKAIYVGRPTRWGNPFDLGKWYLGWGGMTWTIDQTKDDRRRYAAKQAVRFYRRWIATQKRSENLIPLLGGHDLACWCPLDQPCHADVLLEIANAPEASHGN